MMTSRCSNLPFKVRTAVQFFLQRTKAKTVLSFRTYTLYASFLATLLSIDFLTRSLMSGTVLKAPATTGTSMKAAAGGISSPSFNPVQSACSLMVQYYTAPIEKTLL